MKNVIYRILLCGIMLFLLGSVIYSFYSFWYSQYSFTLHFDHLFSEHACSEINAWLCQSQSLYSMPQLMKKLQKHFACIKSVSSIYKQGGMYDIFINSHRPRIVWDSTYVITDQALLSQNYFNSQYLQELSYIACKNTSIKISLQMCYMLMSLSADVFKRYSVTWQCQNKILLRNNQQQECVIVADQHSLANIVKIENAFQLFTKNRNKSNKKNYIYDIRFDNQIGMRNEGEMG